MVSAFLISLIFCFASSKKKTGVLFLLLALIVFYGLSIEPVSRYLSYRLEKDYIKPLPTADQTPLDVIVVLGGGAYASSNALSGGGSSMAQLPSPGALAHPTRFAEFLILSGDAQAMMGPLAQTLKAISMAAVFFGALTYVGNAPNFMIKAIAEDRGVAMPTFFAYFGYACVLLLPLLALVSGFAL